VKVRIAVSGKWYSKLTGTLVPAQSTDEISAVRFDGHGVVKVPTTLVRKV